MRYCGRLCQALVVSCVAVGTGRGQVPVDAPVAPTRLPRTTTPVPYVHSIPEQFIPVGPESAVPAAMAPAEPFPFAGELATRSALFGDPFGFRTRLVQNGWSFDGSLTQFYDGITTGGREQGFWYGGKLDYFGRMDGEKALGLKGFFLDAHGETRYGLSTNDKDGSLLPTNTALFLPKPNGTVTGLTALKATQFLSDNFGVFAGKINLLDEYTLNFIGKRGTTGFQNGNLVFNPIFVRIVPYSTYAVGGAMLNADKEVIANLTVMDTQEYGTVCDLDRLFARGATVIGQVSVPVKPLGFAGHQIFGGGWSSRKYAALDQSPLAVIPPLPVPAQQEAGSWLLYYNFDQYLVMSSTDPKKGWGVFFQSGLSDGNPNPVQWCISGGFGGTSPIAGRGNDTFGIGYFFLGLSDSFKQLTSGVLPQENQQGGEAFYTFSFAPWCNVTASMQVVEPTTARLNTAVIGGLRAKLDF